MIVTQEGETNAFICAGKPLNYGSHKEVVLELEKEVCLMASWGQVDFSELVALRDKFQNLQNIIDDFCIQVTQEISQDFVKAVIAKTPGGQTGALKNNWVSNIIKRG